MIILYCSPCCEKINLSSTEFTNIGVNYLLKIRVYTIFQAQQLVFDLHFTRPANHHIQQVRIFNVQITYSFSTLIFQIIVIVNVFPWTSFYSTQFAYRSTV